VLAAKLLAGVSLAVIGFQVCLAAGLLATAAFGGDADGTWSFSAALLGQDALSVLIPMVAGIGFGAALLASAPAIVLFFVLPTAWTALGQISALEGAAKWLDQGRTTEHLMERTPSGHGVGAARDLGRPVGPGAGGDRLLAGEARRRAVVPALYSRAVAKRSDRRARRQAGGAAPPRAPEPAPAAYRTRQFWLGVLAAACLLVPVAVAAAAIAGGGDDDAPGAAATAEAPESPEAAARREAERLRKATQTRDKEQVEELTERARAFADDLGPVVDGIARTLPPGSDTKAGPLVSAADVRDWARRTRAARRFFADSVSGETGTNVARGAFATAVSSLDEVVATYRLALADPGHRAALLERVRGQRDVATRAWETGTVQLDAINIAVGYGHQHVPALGAGGLPPDDLPEGAGAVEEPDR